MKSIIIIIFLIFSLAPSVGWAQHNHSNDQAEPQFTEVPKSFKQQLSNVLDNYLKLKDALVKSNEEQSEAAAKETLIALNAVDMKLLTGEAHIKWMKQQMSIKNNLNGIIQMKGLEMKRSHFSIVSEKLSAAIQSFGIDKTEEVYVDFCPMANNSSGAYWLSTEKDIENPYFGDSMLKCGSIKATL